MRVQPGLMASLCIALIATTTTTTPASAATQKAKPSCAMKGSKTVVRAPGVRVFTAQRRGRRRGAGASCTAACPPSATSRSWPRTSASNPGGISGDFSDVRVAGRYVAWHRIEHDGSCKADCPEHYDHTLEAVVVYDLQRRRPSAELGPAGLHDLSESQPRPDPARRARVAHRPRWAGHDAAAGGPGPGRAPGAGQRQHRPDLGARGDLDRLVGPRRHRALRPAALNSSSVRLGQLGEGDRVPVRIGHRSRGARRSSRSRSVRTRCAGPRGARGARRAP